MKPRNQPSVIVRTSAAARVTALVVLALMCVVLAAPPAGAAAKPTLRVLAPRSGQELPSAPLWVKIKLRHGVHGLRASLNGHSIGHHFLRGRHGRRRLQVSPNHGLRFGRNVLRVSARYHGRRVRAGSVRFRVRAGRPLAAAGLDVVTAPGDAVRLDGADSVAHPSAPGGPRALRYHWQIVGRDGRSGRARASTADAPEAAALRDANSLEPILEPVGIEDVTVKLTVTAPDGRSGSDLVSVRADPPPAEWIETSAKRGDDYGVRLDGPIDAFYKAEPGTWLQLVVLKRRDLAFVSDQSYDCPGAVHEYWIEDPSIKACVEGVQRDLAKLRDPDHSYLVIAVSQPWTANAQYPVRVKEALAGYVHTWDWSTWGPDSRPAPGSISAIFVPGLAQTAVEHISPRADGGAAQIAGNLVRDEDGNFVLVPPDRTGFELTAGGTEAGKSTIVVGDKRFVQQRPAGSVGGFQVVVVNPVTLDGVSNWFETANNPAAADAMVRVINELAARTTSLGLGRLVFLASSGKPSFVVNKASAPTMKSLLDLIEKLGGMRSPAMVTLDSRFAAKAKRSYALAGEAFIDPSRGQELTGQGPLSLRGTIARSKAFYQYALQPDEGPGADPEHQIGPQRLLEVTEASPTPWPEQGDKGKTAAIAWVGMQALGTDSPRAQFWTRPYDADSWRKVTSAIEALTMPAGAPAFSAADLGWAKAELIREIGWLGNAYDYLGALAKPFSDTGLKSWAAFQSISERVQREVQASNQARVEAQVATAMNLAVNIAEKIPGAGKVVGLTAGVYEYIIKMSELGEAESESEFSSTAAEFGKELAQRLSAAQSLLLHQMPDVIAADYGRLRTVGTCTAAAAPERVACPDGSGAWQLTQEEQQRSSKALETAAEASAYAALLPAKYHAYALPVSSHTTAKGYHGGTWGHLYCVYPFGDLPDTGELVQRIYEWAPREETFDTFQVTALGFLEGQGTINDKYKMRVPTRALTDHLFGTGKGQLGLNQEQFFDRYFRSHLTLDHYPELDTRTNWWEPCLAN